MPWIKVADVADLQDGRILVDVDDQEIVVFKLEDGYFAIDDECSHATESLSEGEIVDDCKITCPLHGALFDIRTGKNLTLPAVVPIQAYPVQVREGEIFVEVED